jgi:hypothetical protein
LGKTGNLGFMRRTVSKIRKKKINIWPNKKNKKRKQLKKEKIVSSGV